MANSIYLDNHATTPCDPRVVEAMLPYWYDSFGNPASTTHREGQRARDAVRDARLQVATLLHAEPEEIVFTSGATESNNLAILGIARQYGLQRKRLVTTPIEHKAILEPYRWLATQGYKVVYLKVLSDGTVDLDHAQSVITDDTLLVSVQTANNEIGTIQPTQELGELARAHGAFFHTDAAQAVGKIQIDVEAWDVDLLSLSGHKFYGPKGVGALYIRGGKQTTPLQPIMFGGGQEDEVRPGTQNVPAIVGLGVAAQFCQTEMATESQRVTLLRDAFEAQLLKKVTNITRNGAIYKRLPHNSSLTIEGIDAETLILNVPQVSISNGSACTSGALEPSYVLTAIGLNRQDAYSTIRVGIGRYNTATEIQKAVTLLADEIEYLRGMKI